MITLTEIIEVFKVYGVPKSTAKVILKNKDNFIIFMSALDNKVTQQFTSNKRIRDE